MGLIQFVQNYQDLSTDKGYQFRFHCDKCGNGYMTRFQASAIGVAESVLHIAGSVFGGFLNSVTNSAAYEVQRAIAGPAHDSALEAAVKEGKEYFQQCGRCGKWVCPEVCWNVEAKLCEGCAPKFEQEFAAAHAQAKAAAASAQLHQKAGQVNYVADVDMSVKSVVAARPPSAADVCAACHAALSPGAHFCPQCGAVRAPSGCPGCGASLEPNAKFCAQCGAHVKGG